MTFKYKVLIVEDDEQQRNSYVKDLVAADFEVLSVGTAEEALEALDLFVPNIIIIDVQLRDPKDPDKWFDGRNLCRIIRKRKGYEVNSSVYIVIISQRFTSPLDLVIGLEDGADFYTTRKPNSKNELVSIVKALIRKLEDGGNIHRPIKTGGWFVIDEYLAINPQLPEIRVQGRFKKLSPAQHLILQHLYSRFEQICTVDALAHCGRIEPERVAVEIANLRAKIREEIKHISPEPNYIENVRGEGYVLRKPNNTV